VALAEASLERWVPAESDLLRAMIADDPWIVRQRGALQEALREIQAHLATLDVSGPDGAELSIDGAVAAQLPTHPLRVAGKRVVVELRASGFVTVRKELELGPRTVHKEAFTLEPLAPALPSPAVHHDDAEPARVATRAPAAESPPARSSATRTVAWITAGSAALFLATGIASTAYAADRAAHYNNDDECSPAGAVRSVYCASYGSQTHTGELLAITSFALAGASVITSVVLFTIPAKASAQASSRSRASCSISVAGLRCGGVY
jgi:hypothetical protein